jgi:pimeloyl-ACP methyl ester carboxylesterase
MTELITITPEQANYGAIVHLSGPEISYQLWSSDERTFAVSFGGGQDSCSNVVLLHGLGSDHSTWNQVAPYLSDKYRYIAMDLPGFGMSHKLDDGIRMSSVGARLVEVLGEWGIENPILLGHSMGGILALDMASRFRSEVSGVVAMSAPLMNVLRIYRDPLGSIHHQPLPTLTYFIQLLAAGIPWPGALVREAMSIGPIRRSILGRFVADPDRLSPDLLEHLVSTIGATSAWSAARNGIGYDYEKAYSAIRCPVGVIRGDRDGLIGTTDVKEFADLVDITSFAIVSGLSHWMSAEDPVATAAAISWCLDSLIEETET